MKTYNDDETPPIDPEKFRQASDLDLKPVQILCNESEEDTEGGLNMIAFLIAIPRIGEWIELEDGGTFVVKYVRHVLRTQDGLVSALPVVSAYRLVQNSE